MGLRASIVIGCVLLAASPAFADPAPPPKPFPTPTEIVDAAPKADWAPIAIDDLLVMDLAPDRDGSLRRVIIQLMPPPFSQGWVGNIRKLAAARWWDGLSINRVQDNYVAQWGDPDSDDKIKARKLPEGLAVVGEGYKTGGAFLDQIARERKLIAHDPDLFGMNGFWAGWPIGYQSLGEVFSDLDGAWPIHCYAMVGVGRDMPPDTGTGAELYAVIGTPPRQLDRNIALVGRVIEGMEYLSALPRGHGALGFYEKPAMRVPIQHIRLASELPAAEQPHFEYLSTESTSFAKYADARANRRDPFYIVPAGGVDICNVPVPIRRTR